MSAGLTKDLVLASLGGKIPAASCHFFFFPSPYGERRSTFHEPLGWRVYRKRS
jgi:hypothetical protein